MIRIYYESKDSNDTTKDIDIRVKLDGYVDSDNIQDIQENDTAVKLVDDFIYDVPDCLNEIVKSDLKEQLEANGNEDLAELIQSIDFDQDCGELLEDNILDITGTLTLEEDITDFEITKIEKYLGGKTGIISDQLPVGVYSASDDNGLVEILVNPSYDIQVSIQ